jgi:hypothetical protein
MAEDAGAADNADELATLETVLGVHPSKIKPDQIF